MNMALKARFIILAAGFRRAHGQLLQATVRSSLRSHRGLRLGCSLAQLTMETPISLS